MTRRTLIREALRQRAQGDQECAVGWWIKGWWQVPIPTRVWRGAMTAKAIICVLLGWEDSPSWKEERCEVAVWDGQRHNGYPEADYHSWKYLQVTRGWTRWAYVAGIEST